MSTSAPLSAAPARAFRLPAAADGDAAAADSDDRAAAAAKAEGGDSAAAADSDDRAAAAASLRRSGWTLALLAAAAIAAMVLAAGVGAVDLSPGQVIALLLRRIGIEAPWQVSAPQSSVFWDIRVPRVLLGALIGAALSSAGAAMQGLFRNPLGDPTLFGLSGGAAAAAVASIVFADRLHRLWGMPRLGPWLLPIAAFAGSLAIAVVTARLARRDGRTSVATLVLAGVAMAALASAVTGALILVADDAQLRTIVFWSLGSLGATTWSLLAAVTLPLLVCAIGVCALARSLDLLLLGEAVAGHSGVDVERTKRIGIALVALGVGASVAVAGVIGFVGLMVPHLVRLWRGPAHRLLLPASALLGATLVVVADLVARTVVAPVELPIGVVTALLGAPFLLFLVTRSRAAGATP